MSAPEWDLPSTVDIYVKNIMKARARELGLTQRKLASQLNVSQPSVANILSNRGSFIPGSLIRLLDALDLEIVIQPRGRASRFDFE